MYKTGNYLIYKEHMNLRKEPRANSKALCIIPRGTCINVVQINDNWGKTEFNGIVGWCCIGECFAKMTCDCEKNGCCYFFKYVSLEAEYNRLKDDMNKIKAILK